MAAVRVGAIIVAAGRGERSGRNDKVLAALSGRSVLARSVAPFLEDPRVEQVVIVSPAGRESEFLEAAFPGGAPPAVKASAVAGGERRQDSVRNGIEALEEGVTLVAVHDAARPLHKPEVLRALVDAAIRHGAAVPVVAPADTVLPVDSATGLLSGILHRSGVRLVQTPQVFRRDWLVQAHREGRAEEATDDASLVIRLGHPVAAVPGSLDNMKITTALDFALAETILRERSP